MLFSAMGYRGAVTAPHRMAALAGRNILDAGGSAVEAMVAAAATIAVVYPHMNGIGGDGFWLIHRPGAEPVAIAGCGRAAALATPEWYMRRGYRGDMPTRGGHAALTVPGTISGWKAALATLPGGRHMPLRDLLATAIGYARDGMAVTRNQSVTTTGKLASLIGVPGFADIFLDGGKPPAPGYLMKQPALAGTLSSLADDGLDSFYAGEIAAEHGRFLEEHDSPLRAADFSSYVAERVVPLRADIRPARLFNTPAPTQGVSSLSILGIFDRLAVTRGEEFEHLHGLVEATKQAFLIRNRELADPDAMTVPAQEWLDGERLDAMASRIDRHAALPWPYPPRDGDTIWMGAADRDGVVVSFIQSVYWEFGSGLTCPRTGVFFQNRGAGFTLAPGPNQLAPRKRPFHTLNPAMAHFADGRVMAYGTMGGEGQPQTQAAIFSRYAYFGDDLQQAITRPRWLLGKTWGDVSTTLKLESRFPPALIDALRRAGHQVETIEPFSDLVGHAGALVRHPGGLIEAAADPRADGAALAW